MPRNSSGTYTLAEPAFEPNTTIRSADVNSDFDDIADALTDSLSRSGDGGMETALSLHADGFYYNADPDTGMSRSAANTQVITCGGVNVVIVTNVGASVVGTLSVSGVSTFSNTATFSGALAVVGDASVGDDLTVVGDAEVQGDLAVDQNLGVAGGLGVTGNITGSASANIAVDLVVGGNAVVTGSGGALGVGGWLSRNTAKAFGRFTVSGGVVTFDTDNSFNVTNVTRSILGVFTVIFGSAMPTTNYNVFLRLVGATPAPMGQSVPTKLVGSFQLDTFDVAGANADPVTCELFVVGY